MAEGQPTLTEQEVRDFAARCDPSGELLRKLDFIKGLMGLANTATAIFQAASMGEEMLRRQVRGERLWIGPPHSQTEIRWPID